MDNEKRKAERHFNDQAVKEAVKRMRPELEAASEAAHKMKDSEDSGDDKDYRDFECGRRRNQALPRKPGDLMAGAAHVPAPRYNPAQRRPS